MASHRILESMSGGCNMKRYFVVLVILLPLAVMAAPVGDISRSVPDLQKQWGGQPQSYSPIHRAFPQVVFQEDPGSSFLVAHSAADSPGKAIEKDSGPSDDLDLRDVDWDKVKAEKKAKNGNGKNGDNGDKNGDEEEEEDEKDEKDEGDGGGGGWDRLWDCPKLG